MFDLFFSYLLWVAQLPILPLYYHLPEWFWLAISLDKISGVFETYGVYLVALGFTSYCVYYRNTLLKPIYVKVVNNVNTAKLRTSLRSTLNVMSGAALNVKAVLAKFFK